MWPGMQTTALSGMLGSQTTTTNDGFDQWGAIFGPAFPTSNMPYNGGYRVQRENPPADRTMHNGYLGTLIYGLARLDMPEFLLQILPVVETDTVDMSWDVMYFNTPMASIVPHEAPSRVLTHSYSSGGTKAVRHGIGLMMDIETMKRPFGYSMFGMQIQQIRNSIQLTLVGDVIHALLDTNNPNHPVNGREARTRWLRAEGLMGATRDMMIQQEILHYALVHKDPENGIKKRLVDVQIYARQNGFEPNAIVCNENFKVHSTRLITDATYTLIDAYGAQELRRNPDNVASIEGIPLFAIPPLNLYQDTQAIPTLYSHVQVGEYALMLDPKRDAETSNKCEPRKMEERTILMYDENKDGWTQVTILEAIANCGRFNDHGDLVDAHDHLARENDNMDMFLCRTHEGRNKKCELFGDMENIYLDPPTVVQVAKSMLASLDDRDRSNVDSLVGTYEALMRTVVTDPPGAGGARGGVAARPFADHTNEDLRHAADLDFLLTDVTSHNDLRDKLRKLHADPIRFSPFFRSWLGLELLGQDEKIAEQIQSFLRYYNAIKTVFGDDHPFVNEEGCPAHLRPYVENPGACNFFERVFAHGTTPIIGLTSVTTTTINTTSNSTFDSASNITTTTTTTETRNTSNFDATHPPAHTMPVDKLVKLHPSIAALEKTETERFKDMNGQKMTVGMVFYKVVNAMHVLSQHVHALAETVPSTIDRTEFTAQVLEAMNGFLANFDNVGDADAVQKKVNEINPALVELIEKTQNYTYNDALKIINPANWMSDRPLTELKIVPPTPPDASTYTAVRASKTTNPMLLPFVYSGNLSQAWNNYMKANIATYRIYRVDVNPMVPATDTDIFDSTIERLKKHRTFMHRMAFVSDKYDVDKEEYPDSTYLDRDKARDEREQRAMRSPTAVLPFQRLNRDRKRTEVAPEDTFHMGADVTDPHALDINPSFMNRYQNLHMQSSAAVRGAMFTFLTTRITKDAFKRLAMNGCVVPCNFIIARPFDVHMMSGIMVLQGGVNTGRTMFALSNWTAGVSPETKLFYANYTFYSKAVVFRPERVVHLSALKYERYCGGHNTRFLRQEDRSRLSSRAFLLDQNDFNTTDRNSMYAIMTSYTEYEYPTTFDLRGYFDDDQDRTRPPSYSTAHFYNLAYGFNRLRSKTDYGMGLWYRSPQPKLVVSAGPWRVWTADGMFDPDMKHPFSGVGKGHHGKYVTDGETGKIRNGAALARSYPMLHSVRGV